MTNKTYKLIDESGNEDTCTVTRTTNDYCGNPRYIIHFLSIQDHYQPNALTRKAGLRKYHNRQYGGGYIFQSYSVKEDLKRIWEICKGIKLVEVKEL